MTTPSPSPVSGVEANGWRPISSAPRDGTAIFAHHPKMGRYGIVIFRNSEWEFVNGLSNRPMGIGFYPTHWMPLPPAPASED